MFEELNSFLSPPTLSSIKKALFIQPHPDDNEIGAGGTMAYLIEQGAEVYELTVTDDRFSSDSMSGDKLIELRKNEALAAMKVLGVKNAGFLGFSDKTGASIEEIAAAILPIIRSIQPDAVFCVDPNLPDECHSDHVKVGTAVRYCIMDAEIKNYPEREDNTAHEDAFSINVYGQYFTNRPNTVLNIEPFKEKKYEAIKCHASQCTPELLMILEVQSSILAEGTEYDYVERLHLLSAIHKHCFVLPI
ncbi:MAG: PIG-L deacetylase family protein [Eubacteriales bacterium]